MKKKYSITEDASIIAKQSKPSLQPFDELMLKTSSSTKAIIMGLTTFTGKHGVTKQFGKAVLNPADKFDEKVGKKVAAIKCDMKYHEKMIRRYGSILLYLDKAIEEIENIADYHFKKLKGLQEDYTKSTK